MSRLPQAFLDELFQRVSIADVVGSRVVWDKRKSSFPRGDLWACCPFHSEKTPSFHVEESKGFYHCFGCQESGNAVDFLMKLDGLSFPEAAEQLAARVGLPMPERVREDPEETTRRKGVIEAIAAAARWFADQLRGSRGAGARAYLAKRGLPDGEWARFGLGYAPDSRDGLKAHLEGQGFDAALQVEAGLLAVADDGRPPYDRFRDRLIFPITDPRGQVIAFGGRALRADAMAKYLNSPETSLFHKGRLLYRLPEARSAAARARDGRLVVAEGYMDVIALERAGIAAVAPLGTAMTEEQIALAWKIVGEPILCFDGDKAGRAAAFRALDRGLPLVSAGQSLRFAFMPDGQDPDDVLRERGAATLTELLAQARPLADVLWERERDAAPHDTPERRAALRKRLKGAVSQIRDQDVRTAYQADMDARLTTLFGAVAPPERKERRPWTPGGKPGAPPAAASAELKARVGRQRAPTALRDLVCAPAVRPELMDAVAEDYTLLDLGAHAGLDLVRASALELWQSGGTLDFDGLRRHLALSAEEAQTVLDAALEVVETASRMPSPYALAGQTDADAASAWRQSAARWMQAPELAADRAAARARFAGGDDDALERVKRFARERRALAVIGPDNSDRT
jgi:DNA primase